MSLNEKRNDEFEQEIVDTPFFILILGVILWFYLCYKLGELENSLLSIDI